MSNVKIFWAYNLFMNIFYDIQYTNLIHRHTRAHTHIQQYINCHWCISFILIWNHQFACEWYVIMMSSQNIIGMLWYVCAAFGTRKSSQIGLDGILFFQISHLEKKKFPNFGIFVFGFTVHWKCQKYFWGRHHIKEYCFLQFLHRLIRNIDSLPLQAFS